MRAIYFNRPTLHNIYMKKGSPARKAGDPFHLVAAHGLFARVDILDAVALILKNRVVAPDRHRAAGYALLLAHGQRAVRCICNCADQSFSERAECFNRG